MSPGFKHCAMVVCCCSSKYLARLDKGMSSQGILCMKTGND